MASLESKSFSNIITFTRASRATYFDSTGIIKSATTNTPRFDYNPVTLALRGILVEEQRTNLFTYSEDFANAAWGKTNAVLISNVATAPNGTTTADLFVPNNGVSGVNAAYNPGLTYTSGVSYSLSVYAKAAGFTSFTLVATTSTSYGGVGGNAAATFNLSTGAVTSVERGDITASISNVGNGWYRCSMVFTPTTTASFATQICRQNAAGDGTSGVYIWGAQLEVGAFATSYIPSSVTFSGRTSTATYFDYTGTLRTALSGEARISYNPSNLNADPFLLLEESRTNSIRNNMMAGAVAGTPGTLPTNWSVYVAPTGITRQIVGTGTVNGVTYIDVRYSGTPSSTAEISLYTEQGSAVSASTGQVWNHSIWLAIVSGSLTNISTISIRTLELNSSSAYLRETAVNVVSQISSTLTRYNLNSAALGASVSRLAPTISVAASAVAPIDITLRIGMPQLELGAGATSVIPTSSGTVTRSADTSTSAAATRSADVASINTLDPWYNFTTGTLFVQGSGISDASARYAASINDNTLNEFFGIRTLNNLSSAGLDDGIAQWGLIGAAYTSNNTFKSALAYATNDIAFCVGAAAPATDATATLPTVSQMQIGAAPGLAMWNGHIRRVTYYPRRLTNAELQALTT